MVEARKTPLTTAWNTGTPAPGGPFDAVSGTPTDNPNADQTHLRLLQASQTRPADQTTPAKPDDSNPGVVTDFFQSIGHAAIQAPISAGAQVIDKVFHTDLQARSQIGFLQLSQAKEGTANYWAQQIGGSIGMLLPFLAAGKCVRGFTRAGLSEADLAATLSERKVLGLTTKEAFLTGAVNDALFRPTDANDNRPFLVARGLNGISGGINMFALSKFSEPFMPSPAKAAESSAISLLLKNNITAGVISGIPAGIIGAQTQSYFNHLDFSSPTNFLRSGTVDAKIAGYDAMKQSALSSAVIGGVLGGYHQFKGQYTTASPYPDMVRMEEPVGSQGTDAPPLAAVRATGEAPKPALDVYEGAKLEINGEGDWTVKSAPGQVDDNLHLVLRAQKVVSEADFERIKALNGVEEFVQGQSYKLWRTGKPEPQDGWRHARGFIFEKPDEYTKTIKPEDFHLLLDRNADAFRLGAFKVGDRITAPESDPGQIAGFDGSDLIVYHPARLGKAGDARITNNSDGYHRISVENELNLHRHTDGRVYSVTVHPQLPGKILGTPRPEYAAYPAEGPQAPGRPPIQLKVGDRLVGQYGNPYFAGYDSNTGEGIVFTQGMENAQKPSQNVANLDGYSLIGVGDATIYRNSEGKFFSASPDPNGGFTVTSIPEYSARPRQLLRLAPIEKPSLPMLAQHKEVDVRPAVAEAARPKIPEAPHEAANRLDPHYPTIDSYSQAQLQLDGKPLEQPLDLVKGAITVGRGTQAGLKIADERVSRDHGTFSWVPEEQMFYFADHSKSGTYVRRAGTEDYDYFHGSAAKPAGFYVAPGDEIRLARPNGPQLKLFAPGADGGNRSATRSGDTQIFFDGKPLPLVNGEVVVGRNFQAMNNDAFDALNRRISREHAKLSFDGKSWVLTDTTGGGPRDTADYRGTVILEPAGNGTYVVRDGKEIFVRGDRIVLQPNDKIHLGSKDGPELKIISNTGAQLPDGRMRSVRENGDTVYNRPDGTTSTIDIFKNQRIEDSTGRILSVTDNYSSYAQARKYSYAEGTSDLRSITFPDESVVSSEDGKTWYRTTKDGGTPEPWWKGKIEVERDGSLKYSDGYKPARVTIERLDGTHEVIDKNGRIEYQNVKFADEVQLMNRVRDSYEIPAQNARFKTLMKDFEVRATSDHLTTEEQAQTFHQIRRLLQGDEGSYLPFAERAKLAEQLLYQAAHPQGIDQGSNNTCNVTTVEKRIFARHPSEAVRLVSDVALTGKYVTADGTLVDLSRVPGVLKPDSQAQLLERGFDPKNRDIKIDEARSRASQIFETTAVNIKYAQEYKASRDDVVVYQKDNGGLKGQEKERLVKYGIDNDGKLTSKQLDDSPDMHTSDLRGVHNQIVGGDEQGFVITGPQLKAKNSDELIDASDRYRNSREVAVAKDSADLTNMLVHLQEQGQMPAIIFVDAANKFFGGAGGGSGGSGHVINVQSITRGRDGIYRVDFTNQWGAKHNGNLTVDKLFDLTKPVIKKKGLLGLW